MKFLFDSVGFLEFLNIEYVLDSSVQTRLNHLSPSVHHPSPNPPLYPRDPAAPQDSPSWRLPPLLPSLLILWGLINHLPILTVFDCVLSHFEIRSLDVLVIQSGPFSSPRAAWSLSLSSGRSYKHNCHWPLPNQYLSRKEQTIRLP